MSGRRVLAMRGFTFLVACSSLTARPSTMSFLVSDDLKTVAASSLTANDTYPTPLLFASPVIGSFRVTMKPFLTGARSEKKVSKDWVVVVYERLETKSVDLSV